MKEYPTAQIRNAVLTGHTSTGKTTLIESLLFYNKLIDRVGTVDAGNTQADYDPEEIKRKTSIFSKLFPIEAGGCKINLLDTPGFRDFLAETRASVRVSDLAVIVVDAVNGSEVGTELAWGYCDEFETPRAVFVNKMDKERADFDKVIAELTEEFSARVVPVALPIGREASFKGVVDLITMKACIDKIGEKPQWIDIPADMQDAAAAARSALVEAAAEGDDSLTEKFLMEETLDDEEVLRGLREALAAGRFVPALCGCAPQGIGLTVLQNFITNIGPSPDRRPGLAARNDAQPEPVVLAPDASKPLVAFVFKTVNADYTGRMSFFKVLQGTLTSESMVLNANTGKQERIAHVLSVFGRKNSNIHQVHAGDIGAVAKLDSVQTGHTLVDIKGIAWKVEPTVVPSQTVFKSVVPKSKGDEDKVSIGIHRLMEADPGLKLERDAALHQTILSGMGDVHLEVAVSRLRTAARVEVDLIEPKIPYRETLTRTAEGQGKHKKQTGGHGQYGDCWIRLEALPRGAGFEFVWAIVGGVIPTNYQKAVEKGIVTALATGIQAGYPAVDIRATCYDGSYHAVDSSDIAFQLAARKAFRAVSVKAGPIILEPIVNVKVIAPEANMGDIMGSLSGKRGRITGSNVHGRKAIVEAQVPQAEMSNYSRELRSMTGGRANFEMVFSHYEPTPPQVQEQLIAAAEKRQEEDE